MAPITYRTLSTAWFGKDGGSRLHTILYEILDRRDEREVVVRLEGPSGSGKRTLGRLLVVAAGLLSRVHHKTARTVLTGVSVYFRLEQDPPGGATPAEVTICMTPLAEPREISDDDIAFAAAELAYLIDTAQAPPGYRSSILQFTTDPTALFAEWFDGPEEMAIACKKMCAFVDRQLGHRLTLVANPKSLSAWILGVALCEIIRRRHGAGTIVMCTAPLSGDVYPGVDHVVVVLSTEDFVLEKASAVVRMHMPLREQYFDADEMRIFVDKLDAHLTHFASASL